MEKTFLFELITPNKNLVSGEFDMVVVPGEEGDFGVLPHHSNIISQIRPGLLNTYKNDKIDKSFFLYSGFAEVSDNKLPLPSVNVSVTIREERFTFPVFFIVI